MRNVITLLIFISLNISIAEESRNLKKVPDPIYSQIRVEISQSAIQEVKGDFTETSVSYFNFTGQFGAGVGAYQLSSDKVSVFGPKAFCSYNFEFKSSYQPFVQAEAGYASFKDSEKNTSSGGNYISLSPGILIRKSGMYELVIRFDNKKISLKTYEERTLSVSGIFLGISILIP